MVLLTALTSTVLLTVALQHTAHAAGTPGAGCADLIGGEGSADQAAASYYEQGLAHKKTARGLERQAGASADNEERERLIAEAQASYQQAVEAQGKALKLHLDYYQAANELGFAFRKTGDFRKALGAYNFALQIKPDFFEAIEYRGEAFLALDMLEQAKQAYMTLFMNDPALAASLLAAMDASSVDDGDFRSWVAERKMLAGLTSATAVKPASDW